MVCCTRYIGHYVEVDSIENSRTKSMDSILYLELDSINGMQYGKNYITSISNILQVELEGMGSM